MPRLKHLNMTGAVDHEGHDDHSHLNILLVIGARLALLFLIARPAFTLAGEPIAWNFTAQDIHGNEVSRERFINHVTIVSFSTPETKDRAMAVGQEIGARYGRHPAYQNVALPNTSR